MTSTGDIHGTGRPPGRRSGRAAGGFTLLEVMVAMAIFALGAMAVLAVRSNSFKEARSAEDLNLCRYLLQRKMEEVLLEPDRYKDGDEGDFEEQEFARFTWAVEMEEITLIGGDDDEQAPDGSGRSEERTRNVDLPSPPGSGDDAAAEEEEETTVRVYRVTVYVYYPGPRGEQHISATTYLPSNQVADEEFF